MKRKVLLIFLLFIVLIAYGIYRAFFDMSHLPKGKLIKESISPNGDYTIKAYVSETSLSSPAVRGELNYNNRSKKPKNIYWGYRQDTAKIEWTSDTTVIINSHKLDVRRDKFDFRNK